MKIVTILGARPQFIKAATVSRALKKAGIAECLVHTGQHFDKNMSDVFFEEMEIPRPDYNLEIHSLGHGAMTGRMLEKLEEVLQKEKPDAVMVYGDTNSTLAGALAAAKLHIPVAHVEAGLRSFNMQMPEEINRILTDRISRVLFCPTSTAVANLKREGFSRFDTKIVTCGDVMYDALKYYAVRAEKKSSIIQQLGLKRGEFVLATLHREENTNSPERLRSIASALNTIHAQSPVVLPLHPRTRKYLASLNIELKAHVIDPVGYFDMLMLLKHCRLVLTDSGGLQKEAYLSGKFCITLRDQTEWVELVRAGANVLTGADSKKILSAYQKYRSKKITTRALYGKGDAAEKIARELKKMLTPRRVRR
ncbi:MAG: UDP-N-acetylglucosamine 2-epimerase (non-hydrolyzing) [Cyclobacteriaceae bacterium]|nr:UDP-N-acetylglucosamine 2-epimerase (non-hydrolyzing) [Cyclobacteriaceae bacterium]